MAQLFQARDVRNLNAFRDPGGYTVEGWNGTAIDILNDARVDMGFRIWLVTGLLDVRSNRLFTIWCTVEALRKIDTPDPRVITACDKAEKFALGKGTREEITEGNTTLLATRIAGWMGEKEASTGSWAASNWLLEVAVAEEQARSVSTRTMREISGWVTTTGSALLECRKRQIESLIRIVQEGEKWGQ